ncbi:MAG TPA: hypothetical protein DIU07_03750 [Rhodobacteraceae bacterium]|nr:hypothetical protein [Paracoccaceae bacterium]
MTPRDPSTDKGIQVLGLTRFSVPSTGAFQVEHASLDERRAYLYDPARLALRFAWFELVTLPGIAAQKDLAFKIVVLMGEDFPEPWRGRMLAHVEHIPQLSAHFAPPEHHRKICADALRAHVDRQAEVVLQFRLDDDDAVAVDFTRRLRRDWRKLKAWHAGREGPIALDYARGLNLFARPGGKVEIVPRLEPFLGVAFAIATRPGDGHFILGFMHHLIWQSMPAVTNPDEIMWVRGGHGTNDSGTPARAPMFEMEEAELRRTLRKRFRVDLSELKAALRRGQTRQGAS